MADTTSRFPLGLCIAATIATGAGLIAGAAGLQWGAAPAEPDALQRAWMHVQFGWMWTWLLVWPSISLGRANVRRSALWMEFVVIGVAAIPSVGVAGFVSGVNAAVIMPVLAVQGGTGLLAIGVMSCRGAVPSAVVAGVLAMLGGVMPVVGYVWSEFFPTASQAGWQYFPIEALASALSGGHAAAYGYALGAELMGIFLMATLGGKNSGRRCPK